MPPSTHPAEDSKDWAVVYAVGLRCTAHAPSPCAPSDAIRLAIVIFMLGRPAPSPLRHRELISCRGPVPQHLSSVRQVDTHSTSWIKRPALIAMLPLFMAVVIVAFLVLTLARGRGERPGPRRTGGAGVAQLIQLGWAAPYTGAVLAALSATVVWTVIAVLVAASTLPLGPTFLTRREERDDPPRSRDARLPPRPHRRP